MPKEGYVKKLLQQIDALRRAEAGSGAYVKAEKDLTKLLNVAAEDTLKMKYGARAKIVQNYGNILAGDIPGRVAKGIAGGAIKMPTNILEAYKRAIAQKKSQGK